MLRAVRFLVITIMALLTGCVGFGSPPPPAEAVVAGQLGPVIRPVGGGPPIECRGVARDHCENVGSIGDEMGIDLADVDRVIVSCIRTCGVRGGEFRIDVVVDGGTREIARGGWGE